MTREWELWRFFWGSCGAQGEPKRVFDDLDRRYREPHRFYHTWEHVRACLEELTPARPLCRDPIAVELALWCHDAVYDPRARDNERRSAAIASTAAVAMGLGGAAEAEALVLATIHGENTGRGTDWEADTRVVLDVDLAVLGRSPREFAAYEAGIRAEYSFLPDENYRNGRKRVLESFLRRPLIYRTDLFRERYERQARVNLEESLERLAARAIIPTWQSASRRPAKRRG